MADRGYCLPDKLPEETNQEWCRRAAESIPAEALMRQLVAHLMRPTKRRSTPDSRWAHAWSVIGGLTGHGSGVSSAIVARFRASDTDGEP